MSKIRRELQKVARMPRWPRKQTDGWDHVSRFIYRIEDLDRLREMTKQAAWQHELSPRDFGSYVIHRWYNFHTHQVTLEIILSHPRTRPEEDPFHHTIDFYLDGKGFDLKLTRLPHGFDGDIDEARSCSEALARWLYVNQSQQGRFHAANRLFVVLHDALTPARTWELRRDFVQLEAVIGAFLDEPRLMPIPFADQNGSQRCPTAGVIFHVRE